MKGNLPVLIGLAAAILAGNGCALHREQGVYGCTLGGLVWCLPGDDECDTRTREATAPRMLTPELRESPRFQEMVERMRRDFGIHPYRLLYDWRYIAYVTWADGSYGVLVQLAQPVITPAGVLYNRSSGGIAFRYNNRGFAGRPKPEVTIASWSQDSHDDLDLDFDCQTHTTSAVIYEVPAQQ